MSRAKVIGLANAEADTINRIKEAAEFGITWRGARLAGLLVLITDVHSLDLQTAQGLVLAETFCGDLDNHTRALIERVHVAVSGSAPPTIVQAGCYSAALH